MTLVEYVNMVIEDPEVHDEAWFPDGFLLKKGGVVHVQDADDLDHSLCGRLMSEAVHVGPARVMLRRAPGCQECEKKVPDDS